MSNPVLPYRGDGSDRPSFVESTPLLRGGRPLKRWRYVGVFGDRLMLCAGVAWVGGLPQAWWAVWDRQRSALRERTRLVRPLRFVSVSASGVSIRDGTVTASLSVTPGVAVETVSEHGSSWIWTRKQAGVRVVGTVVLDGEEIAVDEMGCVDESAGYHARVTEWEWSAGVGALPDGRAVGWNLVTGVHDAEAGSERTLWIDGVPVETAPVTFAADLSAVAFRDGSSLAFSPEASRARNDNLLVFRSDYVQPFGTFSGALEGGLALEWGRGVMERHSARW